RIVRLILIAAPAVQQRLAVAVQIDEVADLRKLIEQPHDVLRLGLGAGARPHVRFIVAGLVSAADRAGRKVAIETPQDREIAIDVHADAFRAAPAWRRSPVLPPHRVARHAEVAAIGIDLRKENDVAGLDYPANLCASE